MSRRVAKGAGGQGLAPRRGGEFNPRHYSPPGCGTRPGAARSGWPRKGQRTTQTKRGAQPPKPTTSGSASWPRGGDVDLTIKKHLDYVLGSLVTGDAVAPKPVTRSATSGFDFKGTCPSGGRLPASMGNVPRRPRWLAQRLRQCHRPSSLERSRNLVGRVVRVSLRAVGHGPAAWRKEQEARAPSSTSSCPPSASSAPMRASTTAPRTSTRRQSRRASTTCSATWRRATRSHTIIFLGRQCPSQTSKALVNRVGELPTSMGRVPRRLRLLAQDLRQ